MKQRTGVFVKRLFKSAPIGLCIGDIATASLVFFWFIFSAVAGATDQSALTPCKPPLSVCVLPFANRDTMGDSTWQGIALADLFTHSLFQVTALRVLERQGLDAITREMELGSCGILDTAVAVQAGRLASMDFVVFGSFLFQDSCLTVEAHAVDIRSGALVGAVTYSGRKEAVADWIPQAAETVLQQITGKKDPAWKERLSQLPTKSYTALEQFYRGLQLLDANNGYSALPFLLNAIKADPNFGPALYWTGRAYEMLGDNQQAMMQYARLASARTIVRMDADCLDDIKEQLLSHNMVRSFAGLVQKLCDEGLCDQNLVIEGIQRSGIVPQNVAFVNYVTADNQLFRVADTNAGTRVEGEIIFGREAGVFAAPENKLIASVSATSPAKKSLELMPKPQRPAKVVSIPSVSLEKGDTVNVGLVDEASCGRVIMRSRPYNAEILADGSAMGVFTPSVVFLRPGTYDISLRYKLFVGMFLSDNKCSGYNKTGSASAEGVIVSGAADMVIDRDIEFDPVAPHVSKAYSKPQVNDQRILWQSGRRCVTQGFAVPPPMSVSVLPRGEDEIYVVWSSLMKSEYGDDLTETWMAQSCHDFNVSEVYPVSIKGTRMVVYPQLTQCAGKLMLLFWDSFGKEGQKGPFMLRFATSDDGRLWSAGDPLEDSQLRGHPASLSFGGSTRRYLVHTRADGTPFVISASGGVWGWDGKRFSRAADISIETQSSKDTSHARVEVTWRERDVGFAVMRFSTNLFCVARETDWPRYTLVRPVSWGFSDRTARARTYWCNARQQAFVDRSRGVLVSDGYDAWSLDGLSNLLNASAGTSCSDSVWTLPADYQVLMGVGLERMQICLHSLDIGQAPDGTIYRALLGCYEGLPYGHPLAKRLWRCPFLIVGHGRMK